MPGDSYDSGAYSTPSRVIVHFGSPVGLRFGSPDPVEEFRRNNPEFILEDDE